MGQILVRNVSEWVIDAFKSRAKLNGTSLESEIRKLLEVNAPHTPAERAAAAAEIRSRTRGVAPSLTLDEIREGLE